MAGCAAMRMTFGQWLRMQRDRAGLSQKGVADALGVTRQTVGNWEGARSQSELNVVHAQKLAALFGVEVSLVVKAAVEGVEVEG